MNSVYIERLMVNPKLGKCDVSFRNGVNVIWAENVAKITTGADFRNSVGKTTFVHLIDFLFGRSQYIKNPVAGSEGVFIEAEMLAEVVFRNVRYTISRRLIDGEENRVYNDWVIEQLLKGEKLESQFYNLEDYKKFLTKEIYGESIIINNKNYVTHRSIMSYLIRDQFYGFSKFDSGMQEEKGAQRKKRLEFLLGLVTSEKVELEEEISVLNTEKSKLLTEKSTLKNYFDYISEETFSELKRRKKKLQKELEKNQELLEKAVDIRIEIDTRIEHSEKESIKITEKIKDYRDELFILRNRLKEYQKAVNDIDNENYKIDTMSVAYQIFHKIDFEKCPFYMQNLDTEKLACDYLQNQGNKSQLLQAIKARKKIIQIEKKELQESVKRIISYIKQLEKEICFANKNLSANQIIKEKLQQERIEKYEKIEEDNQRINYGLELLAKDMRNFEYLDKLSEKIDQKKEIIKSKNESLEALQKNRAVELNKYFAKVIKYITNEERIGEINFKTYEPRITYKNGTIDNGAGIKNAAVVAFDVAMLELALNNQEVEKCRPLILVHDSPKLHDLDLTIYYRLIDYVIEMEKSYSKENKNFQYIITTLDISETVTQNIEQYVRLRLDNSGDGGNLFGCTTDIE